MAVGSQTNASLALLNALSAVSAFHMSRPDLAQKHKSATIRYLNKSLSAIGDPPEAQMAACMMLCIYSVSYAYPQNVVHELMGPGL